MVAMVISKLKSVTRRKIFPESGPRLVLILRLYSIIAMYTLLCVMFGHPVCGLNYGVVLRQAFTVQVVSAI